MRAQREKVDLLKHGHADPDEIMLERCKYQAQLDEYSRFSKKMKLKQERARIYLDMRGRIAPRNPETFYYLLEKEKNDAKIKVELKALNFTGKIHLKPYKIDVTKITFDNNHINSERNHNVTLADALLFIKEAKFSETVWNGRFERYYSEKGAAYVNRNNLQIRTAYNSNQFSDKIKKAMEVFKKYGR